MTTAKSSYTSALTAIPTKIAINKDIIDSITSTKKITPIHIQVCPTNKCNLSCKYCSCSKVDRKIELTIDQLGDIIDICSKVGTKAMTITGGGEPLIHKNINQFIAYAQLLNISTGVVTNGTLLDRLDPDIGSHLTWCRISFDDNRPLNDKFVSTVRCAVNSMPKVDWAFSYVVTKDHNIDNIAEIIDIANSLQFTHVRIVTDILNPDSVTFTMDMLPKSLDTSRVIYQNRQNYCVGSKNCYISLLKPVIAPDGYVYGCCGIQYAKPEWEKMWPKQARMCHYSEIEDLIENQFYFDRGNECSKCYYEGYNSFLSLLLQEYKHKEFV